MLDKIFSKKGILFNSLRSSNFNFRFSKLHNPKILFSDHNSWPLAVAELQNIHSLWRGLSYLHVPEVPDCSFEHLPRIYKRYCVHACTHNVICPCCGKVKSVNTAIPKKLDTDWIWIALHFVNAIKIGKNIYHLALAIFMFWLNYHFILTSSLILADRKAIRALPYSAWGGGGGGDGAGV